MHVQISKFIAQYITNKFVVKSLMHEGNGQKIRNQIENNNDI